MLEKCDYDAVILKPTVRLSQTEEIDSLDFLRMIAHIAECAEESLCQTLVVLNDEQIGLADKYQNGLIAQTADKIHIMKSRSIVDVVRNLGAVLSLTNRYICRKSIEWLSLLCLVLLGQNADIKHLLNF